MGNNDLWLCYYYIRMSPSLTVLSRVRCFLPEMEQADRELKQLLSRDDQSKLDIEVTKEGEPCIEMVRFIRE